MKLLVTSGATREPIDEVRFLSNVSTGATGATLADALAEYGHAVTLLRGEGAVAPRRMREGEVFSSAADLSTRLQRLLATGEFDGLIMSAAVADYRPERGATGKISSDADRLALTLVRNAKILPQLKSWSPRPLRVVGFKLTVGADDQARRQVVATQFAIGGVDAVVHNDLVEIRAEQAHPFSLYLTAEVPPEKLSGVPALVAALQRSVFSTR